MDKNSEELIEILKKHSERTKNFVEKLKHLKPSEPIRTRVWNALPNFRTPPPVLKQQEISPDTDHQESDKSEDSTTNEIIQDIKIKLDIVEKETEQVIKRLSQNNALATSKKDEVEFPVVQVYERDGNTSDFVNALQERFRTTHKPYVIEDISRIDVKKPLLILCQSRSRLVPDIDYSLELFKERENISRLGIVIVHSKEEHALPPTSSEIKLCDEERFKGVWIIDIAYTKNLKFYDCRLNNEAILKLQKFLKSESPV